MHETKYQPRSDRHTLVILLIFLLACYAYTPPRWADWNQNSHFDRVVAIVDHGTLSIDCCVANTGDYALFEEHAYSDKAPGLSFLGVPFYAMFNAIASIGPVQAGLTRLAHSDALSTTLREGGTGLLADKIHFALGLMFVTFFVVSLPSALMGVGLYRFLAAFTSRSSYRLATTLIYCLATLAFTYAGTFYSHQLTAVLLFTAFMLAFRLKSEAPSRRRLILIGVLLGYAVITEYPAVLIAGLLFFYCICQLRDKRRIGWIVLGGMGPGVLLAASNYAVYRTPLPVGYHYSALWQTQHNTGFMSLTFPKLDILWGITASPYRGLFLLAPVLLLALPGFIYLWRNGKHRAEVLVSALAVLFFFAFNSSSSMWWGGFAVGPRYLVPMLPFFAWPLIAFLERHGQARWARWLTAGLTTLSIILIWGLTWAGQHFPEETWKFPWRDYAWPHLAQGDLARNMGMAAGLRGWWSLAPLALFLACVGAAWRRLSQQRVRK